MNIDADSRTLDRLISNLDLIEKYMEHSTVDESNPLSEDALNAHLLLLYRVRGALDAWRTNDIYNQMESEIRLRKGDVDEITGLTYDPKLTVI